MFYFIQSSASDPSSCIFEGELFENEEEWYPDICTSCKCQNGAVICDTEECKPLSCNLTDLKPIIPPGKCCPVCPNLVAQFESPRRGDIPFASVNVTDVEEGSEGEETDINSSDDGHELEGPEIPSVTVGPVITRIDVAITTTTAVPPTSPPLPIVPVVAMAPPSPLTVDTIPEPKIVDVEVPLVMSSSSTTQHPFRPYPIAPTNEPTEPGLITTTTTTVKPTLATTPSTTTTSSTTTTTTTSTTTASPIEVYKMLDRYFI